MKDKKISENVFGNILLAIAVMLYFIILYFAQEKLSSNHLTIGMQIVSAIVLVLGIICLEIAYKKDSGKLTISAIEMLVLSGYTFSMEHVTQVNGIGMEKYVAISSCLFTVYYILKAIIIYTKERKEYLKSLSDIRDIVNIEPVKKEAEKRKEN